MVGNQDDFTQNPFVLVNAPITRRMKVVSLRTAAQEAEVPRAAKVLFIRSQVGENPAGTTGSDTVAVPERDQATGRTRIKQVEFRRLENIDRELNDLRALQASDSTIFSLEELDLSKERDPNGAEAVLMRRLAGNRYDVVHFAGHSLTTKDALTLLVLPGELPGEAEGMSVHTFAEGAAVTGARLVYFSSCQGSSADTVASLGQRSVAHVLGFRWDVEDERAADFARLFYSELFGPRAATICGAFRATCRGVSKLRQFGRLRFLRLAPTTGWPNASSSPEKVMLCLTLLGTELRMWLRSLSVDHHLNHHSSEPSLRCPTMV